MVFDVCTDCIYLSIPDMNIRTHDRNLKVTWSIRILVTVFLEVLIREMDTQLSSTTSMYVLVCIVKNDMHTTCSLLQICIFYFGGHRSFQNTYDILYHTISISRPHGILAYHTKNRCSKMRCRP